MYESIRIQNFRGLKDLTIENLGRVNLLVGANNVGKTSVLEALSLLHMHKDAYELRLILENRGFDSDANLSGATKTLFGHSESPGFKVTASTPVDHVHLVGWSRGRKPTSQDDGMRFGRMVVAFTLRREEDNSREDVILDYTEPKDRPYNEQVWAPGNGFKQIRFEEEPTLPKAYAQGFHGPHAAFWTGYKLPRAVAAGLISTPRDQTDPIVEAMRALDSRVTQITPGFDPGRQEPLILVGLTDRSYVQLDVVGEGARRVTDLALLLPQAAGGTAVIDEVEAGIYYENLGTIWELISSTSRSNDIQVFATTHSLECVEAAVRAFDGEHAGDFRLHRMSRRGDEIVVTTYDHEAAEATLNVDVEFR